jgi:hypothetical protein
MLTIKNVPTSFWAEEKVLPPLPLMDFLWLIFFS